MSVKDRIAAKKAAKLPAAPVAPSPPAAEPKTSRALRFGSAGQVDEVDSDQGAAPVADVAPVRLAPATAALPEVVPQVEPQVKQSRVSRFAQPPAAVRNLEPQSPGPANSAVEHRRALRDELPQDANAWKDPDRPAGSEYSNEEWDAAEAASPGMTVFEMLKADERALVAKEQDANDVVLKRSLLVHELADCDWRSHASVVMEHYGKFGQSRYQVIRSQTERQKFPWADGSKLVIRDKGFEEPTPEQARANKAGSRAERFRA